MGIPGPNTRNLHPTKQKLLCWDPGLGHPTFAVELEKGNRRSFAYHPQTEIRLGPRALRMTPSSFVATPMAWGRVR